MLALILLGALFLLSGCVAAVALLLRKRSAR